LIFALRPLMLGKKKHTYIPIVFGVMLAVSVGYLLYVELYPFPADLDPHNYESAVKNAYTLLGCMVGIWIVYFVDEKKLHFSTKAVWWVQILKVIGGLAAVLLVKEGLRAPLDWLCGGHLISRSIRYCLIVLMAGIVWPLTFPWLCKLGQKQER